MPQTEITIYQERPGESPFIKWLERQRRKVQDKCWTRIEDLQEAGYDLKRPVAETLRGGIYALRIRYGRVHHRVLYGFVGQNIVLLTNGTIKEKEVPARDIDRAIEYIERYKENPELHTYTK